MRRQRTRARLSTPRRRLALALAGCSLLAATAIGAALANTEIKKFSVPSMTLVQGAGGAYTATLVLRNDESSNTTLGSANIAVPPGYGDISAPSRQDGWTLTPTATHLELRSTNRVSLAPGAELTLTFTVGTAPCGGPHEWTTAVKQSNNFNGTGNDFRLSGAQPATTVTAGSATRYAFRTIADPQVKGVPIGFTVDALDACGNRATAYSGSATVGFGAGPNSAISTPVTFTGGTATGSITATASQAAATLAAGGALTSGTSNEFAIVDYLCTAGTACNAADDERGTFVSTSLADGKLAISFERGGSASCLTGSSLIGSRVTLDPAYSTPTAIELRWSKAEAPGTGVANFVLCWDKPDDGKDAEPLIACAKRKPQGTCELKRSRNGVGELVIWIQLDPEDPQFDLG